MDMKHCHFCNNNMKVIDHKDAEQLKRFLDPHAKIMSHRRTNVCSLHQRKLSTAVKRARMIGLLPFTAR